MGSNNPYKWPKINLVSLRLFHPTGTYQSYFTSFTTSIGAHLAVHRYIADGSRPKNLARSKRSRCLIHWCKTYRWFVDGRNPAPPGMYKTLWIMGQTNCLSTGAGFQPAFRNSFLPAIAPGQGVNTDQWAAAWICLREQLEMGLELIFPVMPAPTSHGAPSKRPLSTEEMKRWLNWILGRDQIEDGRRLTSHSCKATCLSYLSKHGASWEDRAILGGHCMGAFVYHHVLPEMRWHVHSSCWMTCYVMYVRMSSCRTRPGQDALSRSRMHLTSLAILAKLGLAGL